jgi:predicted AAA+ superfamily ATPase
MTYIIRKIQRQIEDLVVRGRSILLLGPRQTGKSTVLKRIKADMVISFIQPRVRLRYEITPDLLTDEIEALAEETPSPLVVVDEVQKVPVIMDVVQDLIDRKVARFILTGSSARKLKQGQQINLLPGRVIPLTMDPLSLQEIPDKKLKLDDLLFYGSLPQVLLADSYEEKNELLDSYVLLYLEEEVRREALVRNLASFARFLELAASESGYTVNHLSLSQKIGVASSTIAEYYQILEDCLIAEKVEPYTKSKTRNRLSKSNKYLLFDLGVRRFAAREGVQVNAEHRGRLFEQFIGLELLRLIHLSKQRMQLKYWRDLNGMEVDWLLETEGKLIPIEVKLTDSPRLQDAKHLRVFLSEYEEATVAYVVCQVPRKMKLAEGIYALPWQELSEVVSSASGS